MTLPPYTIGLQLSFARMEKDLDEEFEELLGSKVPIPNEGDRLTRFRDSKMAARWQNNTFPRLRCKGDAVPLGKKKTKDRALTHLEGWQDTNDGSGTDLDLSLRITMNTDGS